MVRKTVKTHPAVTGEERLFDSFDRDPALQGRWVIYEAVSYVKGSGIPDRVIVRSVTRQILLRNERNIRNVMLAAFKRTIAATPGRAIGHVFVRSPQGSSPRRVFIPML